MKAYIKSCINYANDLANNSIFYTDEDHSDKLEICGALKYLFIFNKSFKREIEVDILYKLIEDDEANDLKEFVKYVEENQFNKEKIDAAKRKFFEFEDEEFEGLLNDFIFAAKTISKEYLQDYQLDYFDLDKRHLIDIKTYDAQPEIFSLLTTREAIEKRDLEKMLLEKPKKKFKL
ncbi:hypothetical protein [Acidovorax sp. NCPPB 3576]|uniref:hypothetical protein n=1 Tax=Acidovorax sp. NCPPB 3576 TaxID=2940488 RepID=UPI00234903E3|nr:hypothetical protein [Acidovorax sp. NCPPB 3576]WCM90657.1 hypothetical protein M5C98_11845 [Acidovorax sp. NCPPB 3576]